MKKATNLKCRLQSVRITKYSGLNNTVLQNPLITWNFFFPTDLERSRQFVFRTIDTWLSPQCSLDSRLLKKKTSQQSVWPYIGVLMSAGTVSWLVNNPRNLFQAFNGVVRVAGDRKKRKRGCFKLSCRRPNPHFLFTIHRLTCGLSMKIYKKAMKCHNIFSGMLLQTYCGKWRRFLAKILGTFVILVDPKLADNSSSTAIIDIFTKHVLA